MSRTRRALLVGLERPKRGCGAHLGRSARNQKRAASAYRRATGAQRVSMTQSWPPSPTRVFPTQVARAMKLAVCLLAAPVAGLVAPAAPARTATVLNAEMSKALPFLTAPKGLKGYIGEEAGFRPVGFAEIMDIKWMREAEIKHGRVAMLATIGYTYPEMPWFAQAFPGDAYSHSNPIKAALAVPPEAWAQVLLFCGRRGDGINCVARLSLKSFLAIDATYVDSSSGDTIDRHRGVVADAAASPVKF